MRYCDQACLLVRSLVRYFLADFVLSGQFPLTLRFPTSTNECILRQVSSGKQLSFEGRGTGRPRRPASVAR